jgi:LmbE family N-acetylglucosaminyl deacetylase
MHFENTNKLMIVAHADDELVWAGEKLLKEKGQWDILCIVTPDSQSPFRIPIFLNKVSKIVCANTSMLSFEDTGFCSMINGDIFSPILEKIKSKKWEQILTHGPKGEYGHQHHIQIHHEVVKASKQIGLLDKLWVFEPIKSEIPLELSEKKRLLFENTYDDETNLPAEHPRQWVHGWNTTQGWKENIVKYNIQEGD